VWNKIKGFLFLIPSVILAIVYFLTRNKDIPNTVRDDRIAELDNTIATGHTTVQEGLRDSITAVDDIAKRTDTTSGRLSRAQEILARANDRAKE